MPPRSCSPMAISIGRLGRSKAQALIGSDRKTEWSWIENRCGIVTLLGALVFLFSLNVGAPLAATVTANSCAASAVRAALTDAANDDTVFVPAGSCTWSAAVIILAKRVTLQGAGAGTSAQCAVPGQTAYTCITDGTSKTPDPNNFYVTYMLGVRDAIDGGVTRITGFTFLGGTGPVDPNNSSIVNFQTGTTTQFRFDHNNVYTTRTSGLTVQACTYGVLDHNNFILTNQNYGHYIKNGAQCESAFSYGDGVWTQAAQFGSAKFLFIENNTYTASCNDFTLASDGWSGQRVVFRSNDVHCTFFTTHGTMQRERGVRAIEAYNNTFHREAGFGTDGTQDAVGIGSGTSLVYNNTVTGPYKAVVEYTINRAGAPYSIWGQCNGTSVWDGNTSPPGYPCIDQPGRGAGNLLSGDPCCMVTQTWPKQATEPSYAWNNTLNGLASNPITGYPSYIQLGREYFTSAMPGYVPYTYPHPLVSGSSANTPPSPPTNLAIR